MTTANTNDQQIDIIILAAGKGSRMRSAQPKVMHRIGGKMMVQHVIDQASLLQSGNNAINKHVVVGHKAELVETALAGQDISFSQQMEQLGTGHAVAQSLVNINTEGVSLILYGDVPLTPSTAMQALVDIANNGKLGLLTVTLAEPHGYGRIVRDDANKVTAIVEQKDASTEQLAISEVNTGIMAVPNQYLQQWIAKLDNNNAQGEYYLTDIIAMACADNIDIITCSPQAEQQVQGVNDKVQLAQLERYYQSQQAQQLMLDGATLADPSRLDVRGSVSIAGEVEIDVNVIFEGQVSLAEGVIIGANCIIKNATIGANTVIKANSIIEDSIVAAHCDIGPFARLRPGTQLADNAKVGNFVETKKAVIGKGAKVNHLSYVGDAIVGDNVNIGAGTITCNYDGVNKHQTQIGNGAFIGSNSALVAPVKIGTGATVAAGSTVTKEVFANQLTVARSKQVSLDNWARPIKK